MSQRKKHPELAATRAVGARTIIMDRPPEMIMAPGPASPRVPPAPSVARRTSSATPSMMTTTVVRPRPAQRPPPPPTAVLAKPVLPSPIPQAKAQPQPALAPKPMPARTRMVDLRDALAANQGLPPLPVSFSPLRPPHGPAGPSAPALMSMPVSATRWKRVLQERRSLLAVAAGALVLLLLLPQFISEGGAEALEQEASVSAARATTISTAETPGATPAVSQAAVPAATTAPAATLEPAPTPTTTPDPEPQGPLSEAQAGALLLSGHRVQALASYRELAQMPGAHAGIEAMVIVLEQKVDPR